MRHCRITNCTKPARPGRRICDLHRTRIVRHRDPHFTTWTAADDHDVQALIREQRPTSGLTRLERIQVAQGLTSLGLPATEIARILGVTERTVYRWRTEGFRQTTPARPAKSASNGPGALQGPRGASDPPRRP